MYMYLIDDPHIGRIVRIAHTIGEVNTAINRRRKSHDEHPVGDIVHTFELAILDLNEGAPTKYIHDKLINLYGYTNVATDHVDMSTGEITHQTVDKQLYAIPDGFTYEKTVEIFKNEFTKYDAINHDHDYDEPVKKPKKSFFQWLRGH